MNQPDTANAAYDGHPRSGLAAPDREPAVGYPLVIALDGATTITDPTARQLATWAYETHCRHCPTCRRGDTWCDQGADYLRASVPHTDLPGYATA
ncbi:hypothetical protein [Actinocrinis sp.]|uniref:hypothetical protein n=1 Tax=Actinocrinis sp. TaxID=1920516 RepID=UPI002D2FC73B|nr:hypothetical protein [Actinocrinis sp.]HZP54622.1 hypothetical protein [Actinocrinis sp.]